VEFSLVTFGGREAAGAAIAAQQTENKGFLGFPGNGFRVREENPLTRCGASITPFPLVFPTEMGAF
jgi:hypothetical protein